MNAAHTKGKLALLGAFVLRAAIWDAQAAEWSRRLPHDWPGEHTGHIGKMVTTGAATMLELCRDGSRIAFVVYQLNTTFPRPEFVIVAAYNSAGRVDATELCLPELEALAVQLKCGTMRFNTMRSGLIVKALAEGWHASEVIMRKTLA